MVLPRNNQDELEAELKLMYPKMNIRQIYNIETTYVVIGGGGWHIVIDCAEGKPYKLHIYRSPSTLFGTQGDLFERLEQLIERI